MAKLISKFLRAPNIHEQFCTPLLNYFCFHPFCTNDTMKITIILEKPISIMVLRKRDRQIET